MLLEHFAKSKYYANKQSRDKSSHISNFHTKSLSYAANFSVNNLRNPVQYPNLSCLHGNTKSHCICMFVYIFIFNHSIDIMPNISDLEASSVVANANVNESKFYFEYLFELT